MDTEKRRELAEELADADYGSDVTVKLGADRAVRVKVEIDHDTSINDDEFYGKIEPVPNRTNDYGYHPRPDGFNGNAEKLWIGRGDQVWWQPPDDVKRTDPNFAKFRDSVRELAEYGYKGVVVELLDGLDGYGRGIVRDHASLWGVELIGSYQEMRGYLAETITDLLQEVGL